MSTTKPGTVQPGSAEFEAFCSRRAVLVPEELREGASAPETWPHSAESWEVFAEAAREHLRFKPLHDFAYRIGLLGYFPDELATGQLRPGAEINAVTGRVVRHWAAYDEPTIRRARELVRELAQSQAEMDGILRGDLEAIGQGRQVGSEKRLRIVLEAAATALRQRQAERKAATQEEAAKLRLTVLRRFRGIGSRQYAAGEYRIDQAEADELRLWKERMEAQAKQHDWDAPSGFSPDSWPPFTLESPKPRD